VAGVVLVRDWRSRESFPVEGQVGLRVCRKMAELGVLTRPIGNVIVLMPPFCSTREQVAKMVWGLREAIASLAER